MQVPAELISLDPDCISKLGKKGVGLVEGKEEEEEEVKKQKTRKNHRHGKNKALRQQKRKEEQGRVS